MLITFQMALADFSLYCKKKLFLLSVDFIGPPIADNPGDSLLLITYL